MGKAGKVIADEVRDVFRQAAVDGTRQLIGRLQDGAGGYCAMGLIRKKPWLSGSLFKAKIAGCHLCGAVTQTFHTGAPIRDGWDLLVHLNNDHRLEWLELAKVPEPGEEEGAEWVRRGGRGATG